MKLGSYLLCFAKKRFSSFWQSLTTGVANFFRLFAALKPFRPSGPFSFKQHLLEQCQLDLTWNIRRFLWKNTPQDGQRTSADRTLSTPDQRHRSVRRRNSMHRNEAANFFLSQIEKNMKMTLFYARWIFSFWLPIKSQI